MYNCAELKQFKKSAEEVASRIRNGSKSSYINYGKSGNDVRAGDKRGGNGRLLVVVAYGC